MSTETITEAEFERVADDTLRALERALGEVDTLEVDLQMGDESLIQQFCVHEEGFRIVKCFQQGRRR